jgi:hypothetical protein
MSSAAIAALQLLRCKNVVGGMTTAVLKYHSIDLP